MILLRWVAILWAVICLVALFFAPHGLPSTLLVAVFATLFLFICWTFGAFARSDPNSRKDPAMATDLDTARHRLSIARTDVINAEDALTAALRRRDAAEEALYRAEAQDLGGAA